MPNRPAPRLAATDSERSALRSLLRAGAAEPRLETRARIVLAAADGIPNEQIAAQLGVHRMTVLLWRGRFERDRIAGLADAPRPGRRPTYDQEARDRVIAMTLEPPPGRMTRWTSRAIAARAGMSVTTIQRIWAESGLRPHGTDPNGFTANDELVRRVRDVVGLYLAPPERVLVLSVDDANGRSPGRTGRVPRAGKRDGTTHLHAALEAAARSTSRTRARNAAAEFLAFLRMVERANPEGELHLVLDNVAFHETPTVRRWVDAHPRVSLIFRLTPTSASWANQAETWFRVLSRQAIRRGSLRSVNDLSGLIAAFSAQWSEGSVPFYWVKSPDRIPAGTGGGR
jgi:hypothetical protein